MTRGQMISLPANRLPLKIASPKVAAAPQHNAAEAMKKYPRHGCAFAGLEGGAAVPISTRSVCKHFVKPFRIKTDHDLIINNNGGGGTAVMGAHQLKNRLLVHRHVFHFKFNSSRREEGLCRAAWRSTRLAENNHLFRGHYLSPDGCKSRSPNGESLIF